MMQFELNKSQFTKKNKRLITRNHKCKKSNIKKNGCINISHLLIVCALISEQSNRYMVCCWYIQYLHFSIIFLIFFFIGILIFKIIIVRSCILILLVFADQIIHIALCFGELHLVHSFASIPMQKGFS